MDHQAFAQLLGNYGEFIGAIAVVVTLGFLAIQIRSANATSQAVATHSFVDTINRANAQLDDEELFQILRRGIYSLDDMSAYEKQRFYNYVVGFINHVHMGYRLHQKGVLDRRTYRNWELSLLTWLQMDGPKYLWELELHPPDFRRHIDEQLSNPKGLPPPIDQAYPWWRQAE